MKWFNAGTRFVVAILFLVGAFVLFTSMLFEGIEENDLMKSVVGALLSGALVPGIAIILQFYFRTSSPAEKKDSEEIR